LIEIDGRDLRLQPQRKHVLTRLLKKSHPGMTYNRHFDVEGSIVFYHACKLGCQGIVSSASAHSINQADRLTGLRSKIQRRRP
jgi:ATP-dependent DNA ligase